MSKIFRVEVKGNDPWVVTYTTDRNRAQDMFDHTAYKIKQRSDDVDETVTLSSIDDGVLDPQWKDDQIFGAGDEDVTDWGYGANLKNKSRV
jgi:hypothetical protein